MIREAREVITAGVPRLLLLGTPDQFGAAVPDGHDAWCRSRARARAPWRCTSSRCCRPRTWWWSGRSPMAAHPRRPGRGPGLADRAAHAAEFSAGDADERLHGGGGHPGPRRRGGGGAGHRRPAGVPRPGRLPAPRRGRARLPRGPGRPADQLDRVRSRPGWTSATPRTGRSRSRSWPSWCSCARPGGGCPAGAVPRGHASCAAPTAIGPGLRHDGTRRRGRPTRWSTTGVTYYFCRAGCRAGVRADPAAYLTGRRPDADQERLRGRGAGGEGLVLLRRHPAGGRLPAGRRADRRPRR